MVDAVITMATLFVTLPEDADGMLDVILVLVVAPVRLNVCSTPPAVGSPAYIAIYLVDVVAVAFPVIQFITEAAEVGVRTDIVSFSVAMDVVVGVSQSRARYCKGCRSDRTNIG